MSDTFILPQERSVDVFEMQQIHLDGRQSQIHTAMPGSIISFDGSKMTAKVQASLQMIHMKPDGSREPMTITELHDVPVHFPGGGGHTLTFPVRAGDECLVIFAERSIDNWFQHGGTQQPSDLRMHDINDGFALVGVRSQPNVLSNYSPTTVQLRSDDGTTVIDVDGDNGKVSMKTQNEIVLDCPKVTITGNVECKGEVTAKFGGGSFVRLSTHHGHMASSQPPTPGT